MPSIAHEVLRSPGQPLDAQTRAFMEPRFRHDFSGVRIHADAKATESAQAVNALAYTVGQNVVFGAGQYVTGTNVGKRLLAHELIHTVQQSWAQVSAKPIARGLKLSDPRDANEQKAERQAMEALSTPIVDTAHVQERFGFPLLQRQQASPVSLPTATPTPSTGNPISSAAAILATYEPLITADLIRRVERAEARVTGTLKKIAETFGFGDTQGVGQLGQPAIKDVDKNLPSEIRQFSASFGGPPAAWNDKARDDNWGHFYTGAYVALCIRWAQQNFSGMTPDDVFSFGVVRYHGAIPTVQAFRRSIGRRLGIDYTSVTWSMVEAEVKRTQRITIREITLPRPELPSEVIVEVPPIVPVVNYVRTVKGLPDIVIGIEFAQGWDK